MHLANVTTASLDGQIEPVDLDLPPADVLVLSFSDSDLLGLGLARQGRQASALQLTALRDLRHPMSVDLWVEKTARHARVIVVRLLGGYEWWAYGCDRLAELARRTGISLALLPGECRERDERLAALSTVEAGEIEALLACFRQGGAENMRILLDRLAHLAEDGRPRLPRGEDRISRPRQSQSAGIPGEGVQSADPLPRYGYYPTAPVASDRRPTVLIIFYRSILLAGDIAPIDALAAALDERGVHAVSVFVPTMKEEEAARFIAAAARETHAAAIITTTAFGVGREGGSDPFFAPIGVPVLQAVIATTRDEAWREGTRGLSASDIAMHAVLPELDGRIMAGALSFKTTSDGLQRNTAVADRVAMVAERARALIELARTPRSMRRLVLIMPDYPAAEGRTGYAVGLDVPASVLAALGDLRAAGYTVDGVPSTPRQLMAMLHDPAPAVDGGIWANAFHALPDDARAAVLDAWGPPPPAPFAFRYARFGNITVALAPDRGRTDDRRADYHDPILPPTHALLAFGHWLRCERGAHAIVHFGAHGTLEWLPGKAIALSRDCFPEIVCGALPVIYPFIVNNPGEAAQAKRRIAAVTVGHMPPPLTAAHLTPAQAELERLVDEYVQADGLDYRRRERLQALILQRAAETGIDRDIGLTPGAASGDALRAIDAWLCDLKDFAIKDGQHILGRLEPDCTDPLRIASAGAERRALLDALDARFVPPGPAGTPARGRRDVYPTGRNLYMADPRTMPTPTAYEAGKAAAAELVRYYSQEHGDWPRAMVMDLWASASLRTGGEEIAQGLALMGCRPLWDHENGRVTGVEVLPPAIFGRPRVDVTWRISGLFRDIFPAQIALLNAAVGAVASRAEDDSENPLGAEFRRAGVIPIRVFGTKPGTFGAGTEDMLQSGKWEERAEIGAAYLASTSYTFAGTGESAQHAPDAFRDRIVSADLFAHTGDNAARDLLEGNADAAHIGGFAAAAATLGNDADIVILDTTNPASPRARKLPAAIARIVRARVANPRYIAGQMRHGPRGAADFAETVDRLVAFAETTDSVPSHLLNAVHNAYVSDGRVRDFLLQENPAAARAIAERLAAARRRGLWHPSRNTVDNELAELVDASWRAEEETQ